MPCLQVNDVVEPARESCVYFDDDHPFVFLFSRLVDLKKSDVDISCLLLLFSCFSAVVVTVDIFCRMKDLQEKRVLNRLVHRADELIAEVAAILMRRVNVDCTARAKGR